MEELLKLFFYYFTNIYHFILIFAPLLTVLYIILGGMKVIVSSGRPDRLQSARRTIMHAIVGCVIVLLAYPVLALIASFFYPPAIKFLDVYSSVVTLLALVYIAWGGIEYITSSDNPRRINHAKRTIHFAIEGYVFMLFARMIVEWVITQGKA
jgi:hypothetical protein